MKFEITNVKELQSDVDVKTLKVDEVESVSMQAGAAFLREAAVKLRADIDMSHPTKLDKITALHRQMFKDGFCDKSSLRLALDELSFKKKPEGTELFVQQNMDLFEQTNLQKDSDDRKNIYFKIADPILKELKLRYPE